MLGHVTSRIPPFDLFRIPGRHAFEFDIAVAVLAGFGTAALLERRIAFRGIAVAITSVATLAFLAALGVAFGHTDAITSTRESDAAAFDIRSNSSLWIPGVFALLGAVALVFARFVPPRIFAPLLVLAVLGDLSCFAWYSYWNTLATDTDPRRPTALATTVRARLHDGHRFVWFPGDTQTDGVPPNLNRLWHVPEAQSYTSLDLARIDQLLEMTPSSGSYERTDDGAFDLAAVQFVAGPLTAQQVVPADAPFGDGALSHFLGAPPSGAPTDTDRLGLPAAVRADALAIVTALGNSAAIPQGSLVARASIHPANGTMIVRPIRAGIETSEFAYDRPDIRASVRHAKAHVFAKLDGGSEYLATLHFAPSDVDAVTIDWIWNPNDRAAMSLHAVSFIDTSTRRAYPVAPGVGPRLLADRAHWSYEPTADYDVFVNRGVMPPAWIARSTVAMSDDDAIAFVHRGAARTRRVRRNNTST